MGAGLVGALASTRLRGLGAETVLARRRRLQVLWLTEHVSLAVLLASGGALLHAYGWGLGHARWLGVKLGLVLFLVLPLEGMHAYVCHVWIARGLRQTLALPFSKDLERGVGMQEMLLALKVPLFGLGVPLLLWLSLAKPF